MLRFGPDDGPVVVMLLPLFEEHNRTRTFAVTMLRALARLGVASVLPDLPGQGESLVPTDAVTIFRMRECVEAVVDAVGRKARQSHAVAFRSGALLDPLGLFASRWYLAPQPGPALLRELSRIKQAELEYKTALGDCWWLDGDLPADAPDPPVQVAGNLIAANVFTELSALQPWPAEAMGRLRTVRLESDPAPADLKLPGMPLWRLAEPGNNPALAQGLAGDIATWVRTCEG